MKDLVESMVRCELCKCVVDAKTSQKAKILSWVFYICDDCIREVGSVK